MSKIELGIGLKFAAIVLSTVLLLGLGFGAGIIYLKVDQGKSNIEVINNDSIEGRNIAERTEELKNEVDEFLKHNDPYDDRGRASDEWLQLMERQESIARERGDQGGIIRSITKL